MDFQTSIKTCFQKYADFTGRARRSELWWFVLFTVAVNFVLQLVGLEALAGLFALAVLIPSIAVGVRRLHDLDRTGWWYLLVLLPVIGWLVLIFFYIQPGTTGENRFGPDPMAGSTD